MADFQVPLTSNSNATANTAIVGENPGLYGAALLLAGDSLSTGDLVLGDTGEVGSQLDFTVELWMQIVNGSVPVSVYILKGPRSTSGAINQWGIWANASGALQMSAVNAAGAQVFSTASPVLTTGVWYHIVGVITGGTSRLYLNGVDAGSAVFTGAIRPSSFTAGDAAMTLQNAGAGGGTQYFDEVAVYRTGLSPARVAAHFDAGVNRGFARDYPGNRIGSVLDAGANMAPRSIQAGTRQVIPRYMSGQAPLEEIRRSVEAEDVDAACFVSASGTVTFLADGHRSSNPTSQVTIGDAGGAEIPYLDLTVEYHDGEIVNEWNVIRSAFGPAAAVLQTASDATSISRYFKRSQTLSDVPVTTDGDASTIATALLAKYKDPMLRVTSVTFNTVDPNVAEAVLRRELMDRITVKRTPPGGGSRISQDLFIQKIEVSGANDGNPWSIRWGVSPL